jgi:hypothetical protein
MRLPKYVYEHGSYYLYDHESGQRVGDILLMTDQVSVAYDTETFTMHKHGSYIKVLKWWENLKGKSLELARDITIITFPRGMPVDEINKILEMSGYMKLLLQKLEQGEIKLG